MNKLATPSEQIIQKAFINRARRLSKMWKTRDPMITHLGLRSIEQGNAFPRELMTATTKKVEHTFHGGMHKFFPELYDAWRAKHRFELPIKRPSTIMISKMEKKAGFLTRLFKSTKPAAPRLSTMEESKAIMDAAFEAKSKKIGVPSTPADTQKILDDAAKKKGCC